MLQGGDGAKIIFGGGVTFGFLGAIEWDVSNFYDTNGDSFTSADDIAGKSFDWDDSIETGGGDPVVGWQQSP